MQIIKIKEDYKSHTKKRQLSKKRELQTLRVVRCYLDYLSSINKTPITAKISDVNGYLSQQDHLSSATYNWYASILRVFHRYLYEKDIIKIDLSSCIFNKKTPNILPRNIPLNLMIKLCTPTPQEKAKLSSSVLLMRDQAMIEFLFSTGVRSAELLDAKIKNLSHDLSECLINTKKNGIPRYVYLGKPAQEALKRYLHKRGIVNLRSTSKTEQKQYIFQNSRGGRLSYTALNVIIKKCAAERIATHVTPHMFRHTFATEILRSSGCLRSVQKLLGHRNIASTQRYCHLDVKDRMKAIDDFHPRSQVRKFDK